MIIRPYLYSQIIAAQNLSRAPNSRRWLYTINTFYKGFCNKQTERSTPLFSGRISVQPNNVLIIGTRNASGVFMKLTGKELWAGVTGVSAAGKRRGRGRKIGKKNVVDLNKGQRLGTGKANIQWPGLSISSGERGKKNERKQFPPDPEGQQKLIEMREKMGRRVRKSSHTMLRGWSGKKFPGQSCGMPEEIGNYKFEGFESRILSCRMVQDVTGTLGKTARMSAFVVVGNKNGLAGYGEGKAVSAMSAIKMAKNRAAQHLVYIPRYDDHTVYHNMFTQFHKTKIFIHKKEKGYGLRCHRAVKTICKLIGIKDLHCKVEGSTKNALTITKAFLNALIHQETHQQLADRLKYHVVEMRPERENLPILVASPQSGEVQTHEYVNEQEDVEGDFNRLYFGGLVEYHEQRKIPSRYSTLKSYHKKLAKLHRDRNQHQVHILRQAGIW